MSRSAVEFVEVDGSEGEGGGQILRSAVAFSAIQRLPVRVVNIRAGREVPGLKRQHATVLRILATVFGGQLTGATEGSREVTFAPGGDRRGQLSVDMGTAASITLVLQAVIPAVALTGSGLILELVGGTDVPWSPTFDYFDRVVREGYRSIGIRFDAKAQRRGYFPRGGGRVTATVEPCDSVLPVASSEPTSVAGATVLSRCGGLPGHVAERQLSSASRVLLWAGMKVEATEIVAEPVDSPGSSILVYHCGSGVCIGGDAIGAKGKPAEEVGKAAAARFLGEAGSGAMIDSNLADMLLPLLSLAPEPSLVTVPSVTQHLKSGMSLAEKFTGCTWSPRKSNGGFEVRVKPSPNRKRV